VLSHNKKIILNNIKINPNLDQASLLYAICIWIFYSGIFQFFLKFSLDKPEAHLKLPPDGDQAFDMKFRGPALM
jgi:hypothetical protein